MQFPIKFTANQKTRHGVVYIARAKNFQPTQPHSITTILGLIMPELDHLCGA